MKVLCKSLQFDGFPLSINNEHLQYLGCHCLKPCISSPPHPHQTHPQTLPQVAKECMHKKNTGLPLFLHRWVHSYQWKWFCKERKTRSRQIYFLVLDSFLPLIPWQFEKPAILSGFQSLPDIRPCKHVIIKIIDTQVQSGKLFEELI